MSEIQLEGGDRLVAFEESDAGVETNAGTIPWDWITGWWTWNQASGRWMFVPIN